MAESSGRFKGPVGPMAGSDVVDDLRDLIWLVEDAAIQGRIFTVDGGPGESLVNRALELRKIYK